MISDYTKEIETWMTTWRYNRWTDLREAASKISRCSVCLSKAYTYSSENSQPNALIDYLLLWQRYFVPTSRHCSCCDGYWSPRASGRRNNTYNKNNDQTSCTRIRLISITQAAYKRTDMRFRYCEMIRTNLKLGFLTSLSIPYLTYACLWHIQEHHQPNGKVLLHDQKYQSTWRIMLPTRTVNWVNRSGHKPQFPALGWKLYLCLMPFWQKCERKCTVQYRCRELFHLNFSIRFQWRELGGASMPLCHDSWPQDTRHSSHTYRTHRGFGRITCLNSCESSEYLQKLTIQMVSRDALAWTGKF